MSKSTIISGLIYLVLATALSIYLVFFNVSPTVTRLLEEDVRVVIDDKQAFNDALKEDGRVYVRGPLSGVFDKRQITLDVIDIEVDYPQKDLDYLLNSIPDAMYVSISGAEMVYQWEERFIANEERRQALGRSHEMVQVLGPEIFATQSFYQDKLAFYDYEFEIDKEGNKSFFQRLKQTYLDNIATSQGQKKFVAFYIPSTVELWADVTVKNGQIDFNQVSFYSDTDPIAVDAKLLAGRAGPAIVIGVFVTAIVLWLVTIAIIDKFF